MGQTKVSQGWLERVRDYPVQDYHPLVARSRGRYVVAVRKVEISSWMIRLSGGPFGGFGYRCQFLSVGPTR